MEAAAVNAGINGVALESRLGDTPPAEVYALVVANILAGPLIDMARGLAACTGRRLILSGLLVEQVGAVKAAYEAENLSVDRVDHDGEWAAIELLR